MTGHEPLELPAAGLLLVACAGRGSASPLGESGPHAAAPAALAAATARGPSTSTPAPRLRVEVDGAVGTAPPLTQISFRLPQRSRCAGGSGHTQTIDAAVGRPARGTGFAD